MSSNYNKAPNIKDFSKREGVLDKKSDFETQNISVPCQKMCPVMTNIPDYIEKIYQGKYDEAYAINLEDNVLPGVLGRICVKPCQSGCRHNWTDINGHVEICNLKRFSADEKKNVEKPRKLFENSNKKVAIVGGGPAGLTAARELLRFGHEVTIFEKEEKLGGMLVYGIPRFRLPYEVILEEVNYILDYGVNIVTKNVGYDDLIKIENKFDAILVSTGTILANKINIKNIENISYYSGLDFMKKFNQGEIKDLKGDIVIIGGGFTAVDTARSCAISARKIADLNSKITMVYRRTREYLSADNEELDDMEKENIEVKTLLSPKSIKYQDGKINSILFAKNYVSDSEFENGKPKIIETDKVVEIKCSHLIIAIGQKQDFSIIENLLITENYKTSRDKIFVAGDFLNGSKDVITSIGDGKNVAREIDKFLMKRARLNKKINVEKLEDLSTGRVRNHDVQMSVQQDKLLVDERIDENSEVNKGFNKESSKVHSSRCYLCHYKFEIDHDKCIHCNWCIDVSPRKCISKIKEFKDGNPIVATEDKEATYIWIDNMNCIRCGKCLRVCPVEAIYMVKSTIIEEEI